MRGVHDKKKTGKLKNKNANVYIFFIFCSLWAAGVPRGEAHHTNSVDQTKTKPRYKEKRGGTDMSETRL